MANFNTHLIVASTTSGLAATGLLGAGIADPKEVLLYFSAGTLGGLLPDLDSDNSTLLKLLFSFFAVLVSFLAMFTQAENYTISELIIIWLGCFLAIYYGIFSLFKRMTVHRGIFHSIPAGGFYWGLVMLFSYQFLNFDEMLAWMTGFFIFLGYLIHLALDEIYSVDLSNKRIKKSWGSAMKIADRKNMAGTFILYLGIILLFYFSPGSQKFVDTVFKKNVYARFQQNLLPTGKWFSNFRK